MGRKIDRFVLTLAAAGGLYLYFLGAVRNRYAAIALALVSCILLRKLLGCAMALLMNGRFMRRRRIRHCASGAVMRLACMDEAEASQRLSNLLREAYGAECPLELIQLHPSTKLPQDRLFEAWRLHRGEAQLAICATCACDADARALASSLKSPKVALVDAGLLRQLIAEYPQGFDCGEAQSPRRRRIAPALRRAGSLLCNRRNAPRGLLFAAAMLLMYALGGGIAYLIAAMVLLFLALVSFHRAPRPAKLF